MVTAKNTLIKNTFNTIVFTITFLSLGLFAAGQNTYTSVKDGKWSDASTWGGKKAPLDWETNIIEIQHQVTNTGVGWQNNATINISGNGRLNLEGSLTGNIIFKLAGPSNSLTINSGGNFSPSSSSNINLGNVIINKGGKYSGETGATFADGSTMTINGGEFSPTSGGAIFKLANVVVNGGQFAGNSQLQFKDGTSLIVNAGSAGKFTSSKNIFSTVILKSGASMNATNGQQIFKGALTVENGASYSITGGIVSEYYGNVQFDGKVDFSGGGNHTIFCADMTINTNIDAHGGTLTVNGGRVIINNGYILNGHDLKINTVSGCTIPTGLVVDGKVSNNQGGSIIIDGSIEIKDNGQIAGKEPVFNGTNRILIYSKSNTATVGNEWKKETDKIPTTVIVRMGKNAELVFDSPRKVGGDFIIESGILKVKGSPTLEVSGNWTKFADASFDPGNGTVKFNGTANQIISAPGGEVQFYNLDNNNTLKLKSQGLQFKDSVAIINLLNLKAGSNTVLTDGANVTLKSGPKGTASMGPLEGTINYEGTGGFIVERYLDPQRKAWHFLSVPTIGSTFHQAWQESNDSLQNTGKPGYGTMLTGTKGTLGYDYTSPQPSLKYFDGKKNQYVEIKNTDTIMNTFSGYMVFIRGDRSILPTNTTGYKSTVLRTKGKIYTANVPKVTVAPNEWGLIGNPYPSEIDFSKVLINNSTAKNSVNNTYYFWDADLSGQFGTGAWRTITDGVVVPKDPKYILKPIQSGQAFFVKNQSTSPIEITVPDNSKLPPNTVSQSPQSASETVSNVNGDATLRVNFYGMTGGTPGLLDGTLTKFRGGYVPGQGSFAEKLTNPSSENMGIIIKDKVLVIHTQGMPTSEDTIQFKMNNYKVAPYRYEIIGENLDMSGQDAYLFDNFLNTYTRINPNGITYYDFDVKGSPAGSWSETRFGIVFRPASPTPVTLTNVKAYTKNADVVVEWQVENESNMESHAVETSTDGVNFSIGGKVNAINAPQNTYTWTDSNPTEGYHFYRIASIGKDGKVSFSKVVRVLVGSNLTQSRITIYPNPVVNGIANLQFENQQAGIYQVRLLNTVGQLLSTKTINHPGGNSSELLPLPNNLTKGIYHLEILKEGKRVMNEKLVY